MKMATRAERERQQRQNERHQELLGEMLLESRECADCGGRGPRWASWNLGVFVCIRCAGIHRKLGVHISKVKSVNLDQWTPEQIQCIREMGNLKAKILYEAHLPANFKRPQMDQAVESFIRDKYERKKYFDKSINIAEFRKENNKWKKEGEAKETKTAPVIFEKVKVPPKKDEQQVKTSPSTPAGPVIDLLGLDAPAAAPTSNGTTSVNTAPAGDLDLFGPMVSNPLPDSSPFPPTQVLASTPQEGAENLNLFAEPSVKQEDSGKKQLSKDSILSLYGSQTQVPPQGTMFMASAQVPYAPLLPSGYTNFPPVGSAVTPAGGMLSNVGQSMGMMAPVAIPGGYVGGVQARVMGMPSGVMAQQGAYMGGLAMPQPVYGVQQAQQLQWNITQMTQQMAGMNFYGANGMVNYGQSSVPMGAGAAPAAGQSLGTQMWK